VALGYQELAQIMASGQGYARGLSAPKVERVEIPEGYGGTAATIEKMKQAVAGPEGAHNKEVRFLAQQIVSEVPSKDYVAEARALFNFMRTGVRYTLDPRGLEWVQTPWFTLLVMGSGDCDDHAVATCALATALGHGCGFRTVKGDKRRPDEFSHVYAIVGVRLRNGKAKWLPLDSTEHGAQFGLDPPGAEAVPKKDWIVVPA